jgi:hypothetical protein
MTVQASLDRTQLYSEELGITLRQRADREYFKWFLASLLFGARISETIAKNTYLALERHDLLTPESIIDAGWDYLVNPIMNEGGYVRYDGRKSSQILRACEKLQVEYEGRLSRLHRRSHDPHDLEERLLAFWGVGPVTVNVFLRELRPWWRHADPEPLPIVTRIAEHLGVPLEAYDRKAIAFARVEAGLIRMRHQLDSTAPAQSRPTRDVGP